MRFLFVLKFAVGRSANEPRFPLRLYWAPARSVPRHILYYPCAPPPFSTLSPWAESRRSPAFRCDYIGLPRALLHGMFPCCFTFLRFFAVGWSAKEPSFFVAISLDSGALRLTVCFLCDCASSFAILRCRPNRKGAQLFVTVFYRSPARSVPRHVCFPLRSLFLHFFSIGLGVKKPMSSLRF